MGTWIYDTEMTALDIAGARKSGRVLIDETHRAWFMNTQTPGLTGPIYDVAVTCLKCDQPALHEQGTLQSIRFSHVIDCPSVGQRKASIRLVGTTEPDGGGEVVTWTADRPTADATGCIPCGGKR